MASKNFTTFEYVYDSDTLYTLASILPEVLSNDKKPVSNLTHISTVQNAALDDSKLNSRCPFPYSGVFMTTSDEDPHGLWPGTKWEKMPGARTFIGVGQRDTGSPEFKPYEQGGYSKVALDNAQLPEHHHLGSNITGTVGACHDRGLRSNFGWPTISNRGKNSYLSYEVTPYSGSDKDSSFIYYYTKSTSETDPSGSSELHDNIQPYYCVNMWRRIDKNEEI